MLGLQLRPEFKSRILKGTTIDFNEEINRVVERNAEDFLQKTYPSNDLLKTIEAVGPNQSRPVVLIGERGQGKSHLMTALYHTFIDPEATKEWLHKWSIQLKRPEIQNLSLRSGMFVIAESLQRQNYKFLWDLLLEKHPHGEYIRGKWEAQGDRKTDVLGYDFVLEMVKKHPTAVVLDEMQTWFDGLTNTKQYPWKSWAFNFIQILTEVAEKYPELLVLVVSVRNGNSDAYQQIHRVNPFLVDFKGEYAKRDRKRLLLHRLFENRSQVMNEEIERFIQVHLNEYIRLYQIPESEHEIVKQEFIEAWPFAPHLLQLLEDQILIATDAQETRDLIKILANLFKNQADNAKLLTAANFSISDDRGGITALLDSVSNEYHKTLREKAQRNLQAVLDASKNNKAPHAGNIISALWLRSLAMDKLAGANRTTLQVDITQDKTIDDNDFIIEMNEIINNSFNIHEIGNKLLFKQEENPVAKLLSYARNDRIFQDGSDIHQLSKVIRYVIGGPEEVANKYRILVLKKNWEFNPWDELDENEQPAKWDNRIPIVVIPESLDKINEVLGKWLVKNISMKRNTIRFLLPKNGTGNIYTDLDLLVLSRATLKADEWKKNEPEYRSIHQTYLKELEKRITSLFDRFAVLNIWNYNDPKQCEFYIESHQAQGKYIPEAIDQFVRLSIFEPEDFNDLIISFAQNSESVARLLTDLQEPRASGKESIPWVGETEVKEKLIRLCAKGKIILNLREMEQLALKPGETEDEAWHRMKGKLGTGNHLNQTYILLPSTIPAPSSIYNQTNGSQIASNQTTGYQETGLSTTERNLIVGGNITSGTTFQQGVREQPVSIFGNPVAETLQQCHTDATSSLNLIGKIEGWGIGPATSLKNVNIRIDQMTGAQLQNLLRSLPDGITYSLCLDREV